MNKRKQAVMMLETKMDAFESVAIGGQMSPTGTLPRSIAHALNDGWSLMAPPVGTHHGTYMWWFQRDWDEEKP